MISGSPVSRRSHADVHGRVRSAEACAALRDILPCRVAKMLSVRVPCTDVTSWCSDRYECNNLTLPLSACLVQMMTMALLVSSFSCGSGIAAWLTAANHDRRVRVFGLAAKLSSSSRGG